MRFIIRNFLFNMIVVIKAVLISLIHIYIFHSCISLGTKCIQDIILTLANITNITSWKTHITNSELNGDIT